MKDIYQNIQSYIENLTDDEKDKLFTINLYWEYYDHIDADTLLEKTYDELEMQIMDTQYLYDNTEFHYHTTDVLTKIIKELNLVDLTEEDITNYTSNSELRELVQDHIYLNTNIDSLLRQTTLYCNLMPEQKENLNTEGSELSEQLNLLSAYTMLLTAKKDAALRQDLVSQNIIFKDKETQELAIDMLYITGTEKELKDRLNSMEKHNVLDSLFDSQGYVFEDLADIEKVKNSKFLLSMIELLDEAQNEYSQMFVALIQIDALQLLEYINGGYKYITIYPGKNTTLGVFNPIAGGGGSLDLEIEKSVTFKVDLDENELQIESATYNYGYTVNEIYGMCTSAWTDNIVLY